MQAFRSELVSAESQIKVRPSGKSRRRRRQGRPVVGGVQVQANSLRSPLRASICFLHALKHGCDKVGACGGKFLADLRSGGRPLVIALAQHLHDIADPRIGRLLPLCLEMQCIITRYQGFISWTCSAAYSWGEDGGAVEHGRWDGIRQESLGSVSTSEKRVTHTECQGPVLLQRQASCDSTRTLCPHTVIAL